VKIKKGDIIIVISGNYKGKKGKVRMVYPDQERLLVDGVNVNRVHTRPRKRGEIGGILEKESPIRYSNVMLVCPSCGEPTRIGMMSLSDGRKVRYCKKCNEIIE